MTRSATSRARRLRRGCVTAVTAAALTVLAAPTAHAALPPPGALVSQASTPVVFVDAAPGTACEGEVSSGSFSTITGTSWGQAISSRVGQRFRVTITVANVSTCSSGAGIALALPPGVALAADGYPGPAGRTVTCKRLDPTSRSRPVNESLFGPPTCPQNPAVVNGHLILNPQGSPAWATRPSGNFAQTQVEITVWVRASTTGVKTFTSRVCDIQGPLCSANPPRNASHTTSTLITQ